MKAKNAAFAAAVITAIVIGSSCLTQAKDKYTIVVDKSSWGGLSNSAFQSLAQEITRVTGNKLGLKMELLVLPDAQAIYKGLKDGTVDLILAGIDYPTAHALGLPVAPLAAFEVKGKVENRECFYVKKDGAYKTLADLKGKVLTLFTLVTPTVRKTLNDNGINAQVKAFFGKVFIHTNQADGLKCVLKGNCDTIFISDNLLTFMEFDDQFKGKFRSVACSEKFVPTSLMIRSNIDPELRKKIEMIIGNVHQDPDFKSIRFVFLALQGKLRIVTEKDYAVSLKMYQEAVDKGWTKEIEALAKTAPVLKGDDSK